MRQDADPGKEVWPVMWDYSFSSITIIIILSHIPGKMDGE